MHAHDGGDSILTRAKNGYRHQARGYTHAAACQTELVSLRKEVAMDVRVLDTTIRDGSYEIAHQFTEEDVALVVSTLDAAGVGLIEIGHGWGVGNERFAKANRPKVRAALSDEAHMRIGRAAARRAKLGVMLVAGDTFCPLEYLDEIATGGMDFVRLAFMPSDITTTNLRYVERAHELGLIVSVNCTQSYILAPRELGRLAAMARSAGADWWYVVDSAGGMQPGEIRQYVRAVRDASDIAIGLHAHNNLGLAVANSLAAVEEGATLVDCTLNGLGRATGNAPTEQLILALQSKGHEVEIDVEPIARLSAMYRVLFEAKGTDPMHVVSGAAMLHSRNLPAITAQASERGLSLTDFMVRVGREAHRESCLDKFEFPAAVYDQAAEHCKRPGSGEPSDALVRAIAGRLASRQQGGIEKLCEDLVVRSARHHVPSVLHLVPGDLFPFSGPLPWQSGALVGATVAWSGAIDLAPDWRPSYLLVDGALAGQPGLPACRQRAFICAWDDLWSDAVRAAVAATAASGVERIWSPAGEDPQLRRIEARLDAAGFRLARERGASERAIAVASSAHSAAWIGQLRAGDIVIIVDRGARARGAADAIRRAGAQAITPPIGAVVAARAHELITLTAQVVPLLTARDGAAPWVGPLVAPGQDQAVVDVDLSAIIEPGPHAPTQLAAQVAGARARTLVDGTGSP
jgi:4-hydroxy 2-oxovalerate aldolase